jgi:heat shock protein HslJ
LTGPGAGVGPDLPAGAWRLLAMDGTPVAFRATLVFGSDNSVSGQAPCNRYSAPNRAALPQLAIGPIRTTRMACRWLAAERDFLDALSRMTRAGIASGERLVLSGPDGRTMTFTALPA